MNQKKGSPAMGLTTMHPRATARVKKKHTNISGVAQLPYKRDAAEGVKYYHFRNVKRVHVGQQIYVPTDPDTQLPHVWQNFPADLSEAQVET